jgi:hypothetical protein
MTFFSFFKRESRQNTEGLYSDSINAVRFCCQPVDPALSCFSQQLVYSTLTLNDNFFVFNRKKSNLNKAAAVLNLAVHNNNLEG